MEVDDVEPLAQYQSTKRRQPAKVEVVGGSEPVDDDALGLDGRDERVLGLEDESHLVLEATAVTVGRQVDQEAFGTSMTQALGHQQHTYAWCRRRIRAVDGRLHEGIVVGEVAVHRVSPGRNAR